MSANGRNVPGSSVDAGSVSDFVKGIQENARAERRTAVKMVAAGTAVAALAYVAQRNKLRAKEVK